VRGADPTTDDDLVTRRFLRANAGQALVFVFSPGNPGPLPGNYFTSFAALDAAVSALDKAIPVELVMDGTFAPFNNVPIPAATYGCCDQRNVLWTGHNLISVGFADGVVFTVTGTSKMVFDSSLVRIANSASNPNAPFKYALGTSIAVIELGCVLGSVSTGAFVRATQNASVGFLVVGGGKVETPQFGGQRQLEAAADGFGPATVAIGLYDGGTVQANTLSDNGDGGNLQLDDRTGNYHPEQALVIASGGVFYPTSGGGAYQTVVDLDNVDYTASLECAAYRFHGFHAGPGTASRTLTLPANPNPGQRVRVFVSDDSIDVDGQNRKVTIDGNGRPIVSQQNNAFAATLDATGYYATGNPNVFTLGGPWVGSHGCVDLVFVDAGAASAWYVVGLYAPYAFYPGATAPLIDVNFPIVDGTPSASFGFRGLTVSRTITLPGNPFAGLRYTFTDLDGSLNALGPGPLTMTLDGNGHNIRGPGVVGATFVMSQANVGTGGSATVEYQSDDAWHLIANPGP
jgi:hypothetical protein